jgi:hypothetical protein
MVKKISLHILILFCTLLTVQSSALGRSVIKGQVVDAETGLPIKNAAVQICWIETKGIPGLTYGEDVEVGEDLTDDQGYFEIPKYPWFKGYEYWVHIYKEGYVCWKNDKIFPTYEKRKGFRLKNGMVIKLERFRKEYSKEKHANFAISVFSGPKRIYDDATKSEQELRHRIFQERRAEWEEKAFIECLRKIDKGKHYILKLCSSIRKITYTSRKRLISKSENPDSEIHRAMVELGITVQVEKTNGSENIYLIKK